MLSIVFEMAMRKSKADLCVARATAVPVGDIVMYDP